MVCSSANQTCWWCLSRVPNLSQAGGSRINLLYNPLHGNTATMSSSCGGWPYQYDSCTLLYKWKPERHRGLTYTWQISTIRCQVLLTEYIRRVHIWCHSSFWVLTCHSQPYSKWHIRGFSYRLFLFFQLSQKPKGSICKVGCSVQETLHVMWLLCSHNFGSQQRTFRLPKAAKLRWSRSRFKVITGCAWHVSIQLSKCMPQERQGVKTHGHDLVTNF